MPEQGSSFIPKSGARAVQRTRSTKRIYVLAYISYIVFFTTLFAVIGVFIYGFTITRSLNSLKDQLSAEQQRFATSDIETIRSLDKRMRQSMILLNESTAPSRIFSDIESIVSSNIFFSAMTYKQLPGNKFSIELVGQASDFESIVKQKEFLSGSSVLKDANVTAYDYSLSGEGQNITLSGNAVLAFTFTDTRDTSMIAYTVDGSADRTYDFSTSTSSTISGGDTDESAPDTGNQVSSGGENNSTSSELVIVDEGSTSSSSNQSGNQ